METARKPQPQFRLPIAKSFSFIIPEKWKTNPSVVRWIDNLPGHVEREEPLEPARIQTPKRGLETPDLVDMRDDESHRAKRTRMGSSLSYKEDNHRRSSFARGLIRRASTIYRRVVSSEKPEESPTGSTISGTPSLPGTPATPVERPRMRFVFVGDIGCGKSNLLLRYYRDAFNPVSHPFGPKGKESSVGKRPAHIRQMHVRTQYELFNKVASVDGQKVDLELWDTSGDISLHQLQLLSYLAWDAVFLCFSMDDITRFKAVQRTWMDEIQKFCGDVPFILLGLKKDKFNSSNTRAPFHPDLESPVSATEDSSGAMIMRGMKYMECSAKTGENVDRVFEEAVRTVFYEREEQEVLFRLRQEYGELESMNPGFNMCFR
ncbi:P-loop containing nucleoside triphosphate hydrolase protein [Daldinia caldariorum]|uniref:P-loop containing nucleoside triphosphate hydrolase protein n=1 Tax=Daldinia caldariorum TaxID=326644 RepID=UPI002008DBEA|nr:P-loop containing nucleoside triphosphate hydrolase protein [Daldinia caldariorum]KAI1464508.1 P-loop containing nucleoside triphosphate hydrolase protein [Daldinia caldariorum]